MQGMTNSNAPARSVGARLVAAREHTALAAMDQVIINVVLGEQLGHAVERISLAHAVEVHRYAGAVEEDSLLPAVERDVPHANALASFSNLIFAWHASLAARESPGFGKRSTRDI